MYIYIYTCIYIYIYMYMCVCIGRTSTIVALLLTSMTKSGDRKNTRSYNNRDMPKMKRKEKKIAPRPS